jgi:hypothetical protein
VPKERSAREFSSIEEICNYLLGHKEVVDFVARRGPGGKAAFLMFNEETEQLSSPSRRLETCDHAHRRGSRSHGFPTPSHTT